MSADKKQDRARIEDAARTVANHDYPHLRAAVQYAQQYTALGSYAFGLLPSDVLMPQYNPARDSQVKNLEDGLDRLEKLIAGMNRVAYRMSATEAANTINLAGVRREPVTRPSPKPLPTKETGSGPLIFRALATGSLLAVTYKAALILKCSFGAFMWYPTGLTLISLGLWASVQPDDDEIGRVRSAWSSVSEELSAVTTVAKLGNGGGALLPRTAWDDARDTFDDWVSRFTTEVHKAETYAADATSALEKTVRDIADINQHMNAYDVATMVSLFALYVAGFYAVYRFPAALAQRVIATSNGIATGISVATLCFQVANYGDHMSRFSQDGRFQKLDIHNGPGAYGLNPVTDTFIDLDVDWLK
ncbi:hypothetical protein [Actinopolymorpha pittospori]|uniref:Uncharacterized protein n=1 Tax=Actinopolymorpha pittospori TaxID=648752 RepID=A0A927MZL2_9ACTN|nr:hypothetical protein [Actinopolymorpha pittospori]MBE1609474.1 hypothetical protein [Actinopolymorpha pittospori]